MKRKLKKAKELFPAMINGHANEIKAKDAYPCVKYHILECIVSKDVKISYIVVDLKHTEQRLLIDKNIMYNFASKILISHLISKKDEGTIINIIFDNKTSKITSKDSLRDYIITYLRYEENLDVSIHFEYKDSDAGDAYIIQAADYVANAIYSKYEYGSCIYTDIIASSVDVTQHFPYKYFGK